MKRDEITSIIEDANLSTAEKLDKILQLNGNDINREKGLADQFKADADSLRAGAERYKDYDDIVKERDSLKAEKSEREFTDRFNSVLGEYKPKNEFTRKGLLEQFRTSSADEANKDKADVDIFKSMIEGHEAEYFEGQVQIQMTPSNPSPKNPSEDESYLDSKYGKNPFYHRG